MIIGPPMFQKLIRISDGHRPGACCASQFGPRMPNAASAWLISPCGWSSQIQMTAVATPVVIEGR